MNDRFTSRMTGLLMTATTLWILTSVRSIPYEVWIGALSLALAGEIVRQVPKLRLLSPLLALPGAILIAHLGNLPGGGLEGDWPGWIPSVIVAAIAFGAPLVGEVDRAYRTRDLALPMLGITAFAAYTCVPDTEEIVLLAAVYLLVGVLGWFHRTLILGPSGAWAATGILLWTIAVGGRGREGAIIGAIACFGLFVAEPFGRWFSGRRHMHPLPGGAIGRRFYLVAHLFLAFFMARVAGVRGTPREAAELAIPAMLVAIGGVVALERFLPHRKKTSEEKVYLSSDAVSEEVSEDTSFEDSHYEESAYEESASEDSAAEDFRSDDSSGPTSLD